MPKKEIKFMVELDDQNRPQSIEWEATDADFEGRKLCQSMLIHLWDKESRNTLNIGLWTQDMPVQHMNVHYFHNLMSMADTYQRATRNSKAADKIRKFAHEFAEAVKPE